MTLHRQFIARNTDAGCSSETLQGVLVSIGELQLCTAGACTKRLDETKWSETRDETPRPRRDVSASRDSLETETTSLNSGGNF